jgi:hypothetical protein
MVKVDLLGVILTGNQPTGGELWIDFPSTRR